MKMKLLNIFSAISLFVLSSDAAFWDNVERTELYEMMERSIPEMHVTMPEASWNDMVSKAQLKSQYDATEFEVEANLVFVYQGNKENYTVNFKLGGKSTREFSKPGYNVKIKGNKQTLHGTKNFRLRSDQREASMIRSKITTDILQKSGLISTEVGYTELYINDKYMGFYVVSDAIKSKWIERKFGDNRKDLRTLFQCKKDEIRFDDGTIKTKCINANDDFPDYMEPLNTFVDQVNAARSREDLEKIMDVDNFIKYMAWEYLMGTWDHFLGPYGHNLYWYQQPNGKWVYIPYDHDIELGQDLWESIYSTRVSTNRDVDFSNLTFKQFEFDHPIIKILIHNDDTKFRILLGDIVSKVFNPDTIILHIDEVKNFIAPYVKKDRNESAGFINKIGKTTRYTYQHFLDNCEYSYIFDWVQGFRGYGVKEWIRRKYNFVASYYGINTSSSSPDKKHKLIEPRPNPVVLPYETDSRHISTDLYGVVYVDLDIKLQNYTPDRNYADNSVPVLGVNQYNLERQSLPQTTTKTKKTTTTMATTTTKLITTTTTKPTTTTTTKSTTNTITTTTTTTTINPPIPITENCSPKWGQCGGIGHNGPTCCESGSKCTKYNDYYSQCV